MAYCPAVFVSLLLFTTVTPVPADIVTCPAPFCTSRQLNPSPRPVSIVTVIVLPLFNVTTLPLSPATSVYVVPVWSFKLASNPDIDPEPERLPLTVVLVAVIATVPSVAFAPTATQL